MEQTKQETKHLLSNAEKDVEFCAKCLKASAQNIISKMQQAIKYIDENHLECINSLGELQGSGVGFDIECAVLVEKRDTLKMLKEVLQ